MQKCLRVYNCVCTGSAASPKQSSWLGLLGAGIISVCHCSFLFMWVSGMELSPLACKANTLLIEPPNLPYSLKVIMTKIQVLRGRMGNLLSLGFPGISQAVEDQDLQSQSSVPLVRTGAGTRLAQVIPRLTPFPCPLSYSPRNSELSDWERQQEEGGACRGPVVPPGLGPKLAGLTLPSPPQPGKVPQLRSPPLTEPVL